MFDANISKEKHESNRNISVMNHDIFYATYAIGITPEIDGVLKKYFETGIDQFMPTEKAGYISVGDFDKTIVGGIILNLVGGEFISDKKMQIALLRLVIEINPNYAEGYNNLGTKLTGEEAISMFRKAIEINPNFATAYYNLGLRLTGAEAIWMLRKAIEINPNYVNAYYNLANKIRYNKTLQTRENLQLALRSINKYFELAQNDLGQVKTNFFTEYAPEYKHFFERKIAQIERRDRMKTLFKKILRYFQI